MQADLSVGGDVAQPLSVAVTHAVRSADRGEVDRYPVLPRLVGIDMVFERIPDETLILNFDTCLRSTTSVIRFF